MIIGISGKKGHGKDMVGNIIQYLIARNVTDKPWNTLEFKGLTAGNWKVIHKLQNWQIKKFADKLKDMVCLLIGCTREQLEDHDFKEKELGEEWWYWKVYSNIGENKFELIPYRGEEGFYDRKPNYQGHHLVKLTPRKLLKLLGTEAGRNIIHPNIWINTLFADYKPHIENYPNLINSGDKTLIAGESYSMGKAINPNWIITDCRFHNETQAIKDRGGILIRINRPSKQSDDDHPSETSLDNYNGFDHVIDNSGGIQEVIEQVETILKKEKLI